MRVYLTSLCFHLKRIHNNTAGKFNYRNAAEKFRKRNVLAESKQLAILCTVSNGVKVTHGFQKEGRIYGDAMSQRF
jgi:hypothetical protein